MNAKSARHWFLCMMVGAWGACTGPAPTPGAPFAIELSVRGDGRVLSIPEGIDCGSGDSTNCTADFEGDDRVTLQARPAAGWRFSSWGDECSSTDRLLTLSTLDATGGTILCSARFEVVRDDEEQPPPVHTLQLRVLGPGIAVVGDVVCNEGDVCDIDADQGTNFVIEGVAGDNGELAGFGGDCVQDGANTASLVLTADARCTVSFLSDQVELPVRIEVRGPGRVLSTPAGIVCEESPTNDDAIAPGCERFFARGDVVELQAQAGAGTRFRGWGRACVDFGTIPIVDIGAIEAGVTCTASFARTVTLDVEGNGTLVGVNDPSASCSGNVCVVEVAASTLELQAQPSPGWRVRAFGDDCSEGTTSNQAFLPPTGSVCSVVFEPIPPTLELTIEGNGSVDVSGVVCSASCAVELPTGAAQLRVTPSADELFVGWAGDCSGRSNPLDVVVTSVLACTARFAPSAVVNPRTHFVPMATATSVVVSGSDGLAVLRGTQVAWLNDVGAVIDIASTDIVDATSLIGITNDGTAVAVARSTFDVDVVARNGTSTTLQGHSAAVRAADINGAVWATCDDIGRVKRWDAQTGLVQRTVAHHQGPCFALRVIGSDVVSVGVDGVVRSNAAGAETGRTSAATPFVAGTATSTSLFGINDTTWARFNSTTLALTDSGDSGGTVAQAAADEDLVWMSGTTLRDRAGPLPRGTRTTVRSLSGGGNVLALLDAQGLTIWRSRVVRREVPTTITAPLVCAAPCDPTFASGEHIVGVRAGVMTRTTLPRAPRAWAEGSRLYTADNNELAAINVGARSTLGAAVVDALAINDAETLLATAPQTQPGVVVVRELPLGDVFRTFNGLGTAITPAFYDDDIVVAADGNGGLTSLRVSTAATLGSTTVMGPVRRIAHAPREAAPMVAMATPSVITLVDVAGNGVLTAREPINVDACSIAGVAIGGGRLAVACANEVLVLTIDGGLRAVIAARSPQGVAFDDVTIDAQLWFIDGDGLHAVDVGP
jgi:hypothetical protein